MPRTRLKRAPTQSEEVTARPPHAPKNAEIDSSQGRVSHRGVTDAALLTDPELSGHAHDARRAELLTELQRSYGNAYVNEFIGNQIVAARGHGSPLTTGRGSHGDPIKKPGKTLNV